MLKGEISNIRRLFLGGKCAVPQLTGGSLLAATNEEYPISGHTPSRNHVWPMHSEHFHLTISSQIFIVA